MTGREVLPRPRRGTVQQGRFELRQWSGRLGGEANVLLAAVTQRTGLFNSTTGGDNTTRKTALRGRTGKGMGSLEQDRFYYGKGRHGLQCNKLWASDGSVLRSYVTIECIARAFAAFCFCYLARDGMWEELWIENYEW